ncbi:MAG: sugar phosphate isomerase/epimerase [Ignavibacteriaceae bacterium]
MKKNGYSRKDFLKLMGLGAAAAALPNLDAFPFSKYKPKIGLQLYTVRKQIEKDFEGSMKQVADTGYLGIETYTLPSNLPLDHAAKVFKDLGLKVFSMHTAELPVGVNRDAALKMADAYQCDHLVYPGWPQADKYIDIDAIKHMVDVYDENTAFFKSKGIHFGLHNHWWEFQKTSYGIYPFYYLKEHCNKDIFFEIDTYWAKTAGLDPAKIVKDFGERAPLLHIKDGPAIMGDEANKQVPVGQGVMDFPAIAHAGGSNIKWMIVEFDEYAKNIFDGITESYKYLVKKGLAEGKV